jgi:hypothetical protein
MNNGGPTSDASSAAEAFSNPYQVELTATNTATYTLDGWIAYDASDAADR